MKRFLNDIYASLNIRECLTIPFNANEKLNYQAQNTSNFVGGSQRCCYVTSGMSMDANQKGVGLK